MHVVFWTRISVHVLLDASHAGVFTEFLVSSQIVLESVSQSHHPVANLHEEWEVDVEHH